MIRVKQAKVFPIDVEEAIQALPELGGEYQIILEKPGILNTLKVKAECSRGISPHPELKAKTEKGLEKTTKASSEVELVPYGGIPRSTAFKAQRIIKNYKSN